MNRKLQTKAERSLFQTKKFLPLKGIIITLPSPETIVQKALTTFFVGQKPTLKTWFFQRMN
ncbi:hypothetical protein [Nostoc commune]|uniref:hypothetical protein n=1 Tax=Nostoc commune TaxID=1178 RepID=UPI0018C518B2|nr:hypothetical protein [Nostoc commune]MBG1261839.1 hypothetical protein [Nostoc commune BAE]MBG1264441.1 hypothetical protein [Nostoc commune BAE]